MPRVLSRPRAKALLKKMSGSRILVIGDLMLDQFIWGSVERISPEAPVPVICVERESAMPGGAANVASNVRALGGETFLLGVVGPDSDGTRLRQELQGRGLSTEYIYVDRRRPTTTKTRIIGQRQQMVRIDRERIERVTGDLLEVVVEAAREAIPRVDGVVVEDYGKGLIHPGLLKPVIALAKRYKKVITVDPKEEHIHYYRGVTALTPNRKEAALAAGIPITDELSLRRAAQRLLSRLRPEVLLITLGEDGMALFFRDGRKPVKIPTMAREVFDVSGAGDTVIATFTLARAAGASFPEAAVLANTAAGVVVEKVGVATCSAEELIQRLL